MTLHAHSQAERQQRVLEHLPMVRREVSRIARRLPRGVDLDDLVSAGTLGLLAAADRYDPGRGLSFGAFACHRIKGAILDELRALDSISRRQRQRRRDIERLRHRLTGELGRPPTAEWVAAELGMGLDEFETEQAELAGARRVPLEELSAERLEERLDGPDDREPLPERALLRKELRQRLARAIERLPDRERTVISLYYHAALAYREIADLFGVTESRVCQLHRAACQRIRAWLEEDPPAGQAPLQ